MAKLENGELNIDLEIDTSQLSAAMDMVMQKYNDFLESIEQLKKAQITYSTSLPDEPRPWWKFWKSK